MKIIITLIFILILGVAAFGQTGKNNSDTQAKPNFSGNWILDPTKNKNAPFDLSLTVIHKDPEMNVTKIYNFKGAKRTVEQAYYTDGRRIPDAVMDSDTASTEINWTGNVLTRKYQVAKTQGKTLVQMNTERWELSKDGTILTLTITETVPATPPKQFGVPQNNPGVLSAADTVTKLKFKRADKDIQ